MKILNNYRELAVKNVPIVVFDLETTGLSRKNDRIVEIGAVKIYNNEVVDKLSFLVNPGIAIPYYATKVHGITNKMVNNSISDVEGVKRLVQFIGDSLIVAHNISFDIGFINTYLEREFKDPLTNTLVDTVRFSRKMFPGLARYTLESLADNFKITQTSAHRAFDDSYVCYKIFQECCKKLNNTERINEY